MKSQEMLLLEELMHGKEIDALTAQKKFGMLANSFNRALFHIRQLLIPMGVKFGKETVHIRTRKKKARYCIHWISSARTSLSVLRKKLLVNKSKV